jgi:hypothetical protein
MKDHQQFEQLMLQYNQLKSGSQEIRRLIEIEDFDSVMTMLKSRDALFLNCKCMRKFLELDEEQEKKLNSLLDEIRTIEVENMKILEKSMEQVKIDLRRSQQTEKIQQAYDFSENKSGSIINYAD